MMIHNPLILIKNNSLFHQGSYLDAKLICAEDQACGGAVANSGDRVRVQNLTTRYLT